MSIWIPARKQLERINVSVTPHLGEQHSDSLIIIFVIAWHHYRALLSFLIYLMMNLQTLILFFL